MLINKKIKRGIQNTSLCDSGGIQTHNLLIRSQMLYSVELRNLRSLFCGCKGTHFFGTHQIFSQLFSKKVNNRWEVRFFFIPLHLLSPRIMKTLLILVGKTTDKHFAAGINDYVERIGHYMPFEIVTIPDLKNTKSLTEEQQKSLEGDLILKQLQPSDTVVLLDEHGRELRSLEFARWIEQKRNTARRLVFVVGGPYGFSKEVYARCNEQLSLSKMTFSHQMIRLIFTEQVYRACTIIKGEPYHHE